MTAVNAYVGQPIARIEDPRLLRGQGQFVDDVRLAGMLHAAILRSSVAVAVVIAESLAIAEDALELIALEIETLPPCVDTDRRRRTSHCCSRKRAPTLP